METSNETNVALQTFFDQFEELDTYTKLVLQEIFRELCQEQE